MVHSKRVCGRAPNRERSSTKPGNDYRSVTLSVVLASVSGEGTHCHTAIHGPSLWGVDEEESHGRDKYKGSNDTNVLLLKHTQSFSIILIEDNKEDVPSCGKCPEYICQRKPAILLVNIALDGVGLPASGRTFGERMPGTGIMLSHFPNQARREISS